jgi:hypothetical protein
MPSWRALLWLFFTAGLTATALLVGLHLSRPSRPVIDERLTISILRSEELAFLVTRRAATQVVIDHSETDWWGEWRGVLWATVSWRWGVDVAKIGPQDIRREGQAIIVRLPEPELLDMGVQPGSLGFLSKSTAMPKLLDFTRGGSQRQMLEQKLHERAMQFASEQGLMPSRAEIVRQANSVAAPLCTAGVEVRFE